MSNDAWIARLYKAAPLRRITRRVRLNGGAAARGPYLVTYECGHEEQISLTHDIKLPVGKYRETTLALDALQYLPKQRCRACQEDLYPEIRSPETYPERVERHLDRLPCEPYKPC